MEGPVRFLLPLCGVSAIDAPGKPFHDPARRCRIVRCHPLGLGTPPNRKLIEIDAHINDPAFAEAAVHAFHEIIIGDLTMARAYASIILKAPVETVWSLIRDFNGLPKWAPAIAQSKIEGGLDADVVGCVRSFHTP